MTIQFIYFIYFINVQTHIEYCHTCVCKYDKYSISNVVN